MKLSLPPKLVGKLVWVLVISFCKIFIPSYVFGALLCRNWPFSLPNRLTLWTTLISNMLAHLFLAEQMFLQSNLPPLWSHVLLSKTSLLQGTMQSHQCSLPWGLFNFFISKGLLSHQETSSPLTNCALSPGKHHSSPTSIIHQNYDFHELLSILNLIHLCVIKQNYHKKTS